MIIEISVAIVAIAFVALVIYLIVLIRAVKVTLSHVNHLINDARKQLDDVGTEAKKTIEHTNQISADLKHKMGSLDSLFQSVANVGDVLEHKAESFKQTATKSLQNEEHTSNLDSSPIDFPHKMSEKHVKAAESVIVAEILELASLGIRLWQKLKKRR